MTDTKKRGRGAAGRLLVPVGALALAAALSAPPAQAVPDFYWEEPVRLSRAAGAYPETFISGRRVVAIWQENVPAEDGGAAWLSAVSYAPDGTPARAERFAGPYVYRGDSPPLFSAAASRDGTVAVAVSSGERTVSVFVSSDNGLSFAAKGSIESAEPVVAPRIFPRADGGWYLFATQGQTTSLSIQLARSPDAVSWTGFGSFLGGDSALSLSFLPVAASVGGRDIVVFQSLSSGSRPTYQLFSRVSADGGQTWSAPRRVTDFLDPIRRERASADDFVNQRPHLASVAGQLWMAWERGVLNERAVVYAARLDQDGAAVPDTVERVSAGQEATAPRLLEADGQPAVMWADKRRGSDRVYIAFREGFFWREQDLSARSGSAGLFGRAVYRDDALWAFWQSGSGSSSSVLALLPDKSVAAPSLSPADFSPGQASRSARAGFRWTSPEDSSGIMGFKYLWSRDPEAAPEADVTGLQTATRSTQEATEDGAWYFSVRAVDYAGNWSAPSRASYVRDTTPPSEPRPEPPAASADGFLSSNTFSLTWSAPPEGDLAGYSWILEYLGPLDRPPARKRPKPDPSLPAAEYSLSPATAYEERLWSARAPAYPAPSIRTTGRRADFANIDDGYWAFSVAAVDRTGNMGTAARVILRADKFVPVTLVSDVLSERDDFGTMRVRLIGRGFSEDGPVTRLAIDDDGREPFERVYELSAGDYSIRSDRLLDGAELADLPAGTWRIGVYHPRRGWYFTRPSIRADDEGNIKFGEPGPPWKPSWAFLPVPKSLLDLGTLFMLAAIALPLLGMVLSLRQVSLVMAEGRTIRLEALALLEGKPMPAKERERAAKAAIRKGTGLTAKFAFFISLLVLLVVAMVSLPLAMQMIRDQSSTLATGLEQRAKVLLESAAQGARSYLPGRNQIELSYLPDQISAIPDALYMTITGFGRDRATSPEAIWATNDETQKDAQIGVTVLRDALSPAIADIARTLDEKAAAEVGALAESLQAIRDEASALSTNLNPTLAQQARINELSSAVPSQEKALNDRLSALATASISSVPPFDPGKLSLQAEEFVFYEPILYSRPREPLYYRGMVRLAVSTELIVAEVRDARQRLIRSIGIIAAIALGAGILGSLILSGIIINPIRKLVRGIETIRDTADKKELSNFSITVTSRDELATLANTINEMTLGLVVAAKEAEFLTVGKETQKMFIPLETNATGEKLTTGFEDTPTHSFFGYYEGAKGVSGDYFDYRQLDERYWAFIKCDVAGKGIPAALIMVGVATIFSSEFQGWSFKKDGIRLDRLAYKINDFLYRRGFKGRFAAFLMGVYDARTGAVYVCHAGDNMLYIYSAAERRLVEHPLDEAPAAGPMDNELVEMKAPYKQVMKKLEVGDALVLFTDGFEESNRARRKPDFSQIMEKKVMRDREGKESLHDELAVEAIGQERINAAVEAIMNGGKFSFKKQDDPLGPDAHYDFDFGSFAGKPEELVLGLAAIEKVFRMVPDPKATQDDMVLVDRKIDAVLERCFLQYGVYCRDKIDHPDRRRAEYLYYRRLKEDDQYDDLTMMVIRRNA